MSNKRHFVLGLFFLSVVGLLAYYTLFFTDLRLFGDSQTLTIYFPRAHGLRQGDAVQVAGVRWGKVSEIVYDPDAPLDRRIVVTADLDRRIQLREDYSVAIATATLLGGRVLSVDPGSFDRAAIEDVGGLRGTVAPDPIEALGDLLRDNEAAVGEAIRSVREILEGVRQGRGVMGRIFRDEELGESLATSVKNAERISASVAAGEGTLGRLLTSDDVYRQVERIAADLEAITVDILVLTTDVKSGKGLVGKVLTDEGLGEDVSQGIERLREVVDRIHRGEGLLGMLTSDSRLSRDAATIVRRLVEGEGTLGKLFANDELYQRVAAIGDDVSAIAAQVREGKGTVGKLVMDEELYDQIRLAVGLITRSLEEYREAAPISTMTGVIFGAF